MKFVVLGDAHLWPVLWQRMPEARNDAFVAAAQVLEYAASEGLPVVSSGDIFNFGQKGGVSACLALLQAWLPQLNSFNFIVGNHDLTGYTSGVMNPPWLEAFDGMENVLRLNGLIDDLGKFEGLRLGGIDYCHGRTDFLEKLNAIREEKLDILVIHQGLKEILGYEGAWEVEASELEGAAQLVICGHTHVTWEKLPDKGAAIISPGSTIPWQFDEEHEKRFPIVEFIEGQFSGVEWRDIKNRRPILTHTVTNREEMDKLLEGVRAYELDQDLHEDIRNPIMKLRYIADEKFHEELMEATENKMILDLTVDRIQLTGQLNLGALEDKPADVDDIAVATHKHTSPGRVRDAAIEIQRTKDPEGVIEKHINALMEREDARVV